MNTHVHIYRVYACSMMSRGLLFGRAEWPGVGSLLLSSTHLESFVGPEKNQEVVANRRSQARGAAATSRKRLQPIAPEAETCAPEAATCAPEACNPVHQRLQPSASVPLPRCASSCATLRRCSSARRGSMAASARCSWATPTGATRTATRCTSWGAAGSMRGRRWAGPKPPRRRAAGRGGSTAASCSPSALTLAGARWVPRAAGHRLAAAAAAAMASRCAWRA